MGTLIGMVPFWNLITNKVNGILQVHLFTEKLPIISLASSIYAFMHRPFPPPPQQCLTHGKLFFFCILVRAIMGKLTEEAGGKASCLQKPRSGGGLVNEEKQNRPDSSSLHVSWQ